MQSIGDNDLIIITSGVILVMYEVDRYIRVGGECPYENYVQGLFNTGKKKAAAKITVVVDRLAQFGSQELVRLKKAEKMNDVWQLRVERHRVFYFWDSERRTYILLNGFLKQRQKTPPREIGRAERLKREYFSRITREG